MYECSNFVSEFNKPFKFNNYNNSKFVVTAPVDDEYIPIPYHLKRQLSGWAITKLQTIPIMINYFHVDSEFS